MICQLPTGRHGISVSFQNCIPLEMIKVLHNDQTSLESITIIKWVCLRGNGTNWRELLKHSTIPLFSDISPLNQRVNMFLFSGDKEKKMIRNHKLTALLFFWCLIHAWCLPIMLGPTISGTLITSSLVLFNLITTGFGRCNLLLHSCRCFSHSILPPLPAWSSALI